MSKKILIPSQQELEEQYNQPGVSISELARRYNTSQPTVRKWLMQYDIQRKTQEQASREVNAAKRPSLPNRDEFEIDFYSMSIDQLELKYRTGQSTLYMWRDVYDLQAKDHSQSCIIGKNKQFEAIRYSKQQVVDVYELCGNLSIAAEKLGISYAYMRSLCKLHDIEVVNPKRSKQENDLYNFCVSISPADEWKVGDRTAIAPLELDILNTERRVAIEYCGSYWHSETYGRKDRNYHVRKLQACRANGIQLLTVFEFDDQRKVQELIKTVVGGTTPINARDTVVTPIDSTVAARFYQQHHLSGSVGASIHLGLVHHNTRELVMMASFGKARNGIHTYECMRMSSDGSYRVRGGASKLFKHFDNRMQAGETLITYADLRFGEGSTYLHCGFERLPDTKPNYWYFHKNTPHIKHSRVAFQKHKQKGLLEKFDSSLSEYQNMLANGYDRIWDCGNAVYVKKKGS